MWHRAASARRCPQGSGAPKNPLRYSAQPDISQHMLHQVARQVESCFTAINAQSGKAGQALTENDWLMSTAAAWAYQAAPAVLTSRPITPGAGLDPRFRQRDLEDWAAELTPLGQSLELVTAAAARNRHPPARSRGARHSISTDPGFSGSP